MATNRIKGITIEIDGDSKKLTDALKSVNKEVTNAQKALGDVNKLLKLDPGNTDLLVQKQKYLTEAIDATKRKLDEEKAALEQLKNAPQTEETIRQQEALTREIVDTEQALEKLTDQYRQFGSVSAQEIAAAGEKVESFGNKLKSAGDSVAGVGRDLTAKVTVPIVGGMTAAIKSATDFESAFTGVTKTVDGTEEEYKQLSDWIKEASTRMASSKEDIAGVMEIAGQLGVRGVKDLESFTETMIMLGDTTNLSSEEAATALARFMNITGVSYQDASKLGSAVVDLGNHFATSESEIVEMSTRLASAGTIAGLSATDILALAASMSSVGIEAEAGGTAMSQTLKQIQSTVELAASGSDGAKEKLETFAKVAGMSADQFSQSWKKEPIEAIQAFIKGLGNLDEESGSTIIMLDELGMSGIRQSNMLQALSLSVDTLNDAVGTSGSAFKENTALMDEAAKRYATSESQMVQFGEEVKNLAIEFGETLLPYLKQAMEAAREWLHRLQELSPEQRDMVIKIAAVAAAIGPLLLVTGKLASAIGSIITVSGKLIQLAPKITGFFASFSKGAGAAAKSAEAMATASETVAGSAGKLGGAAAKASSGASTAASGFSALSGVLEGGVIAGTVAAAAELNKLDETMRGGNGALTEFGSGLHNVQYELSQMGSIGKDQADALYSSMEQLESSGASNAEMMSAFVAQLREFGVSSHDATTALSTLYAQGSISQDLFDRMNSRVASLGAGMTAARTVSDESALSFASLSQAVMNVGNNMGLSEVSMGSLNEAMYNADGSARTVDEAYTALMTTLDALNIDTDTFTAKLQESLPNATLPTIEAFGQVGQTATQMGSEITTAFDNSTQSAEQTTQSFTEKVLEWFKQLKYNLIGDPIVLDMLNGIVKAFADLLGGDAIKQIVSFKDAAYNKFKEMASQAKTWGRDIVNGLAAGIRGAIGAVTSAVTSVADAIRSRIHFTRPDVGPLREYERWMPDMMAGLAQGIRDNIDMVQSAMADVGSAMAGSMNVDYTPQLDRISGNLATMNATAAAGPAGDLYIPVYIGSELIDEIVVEAGQRNSYRSGGR